MGLVWLIRLTIEKNPRHSAVFETTFAALIVAHQHLT